MWCSAGLNVCAYPFPLKVEPIPRSIPCNSRATPFILILLKKEKSWLSGQKESSRYEKTDGFYTHYTYCVGTCCGCIFGTAYGPKLMATYDLDPPFCDTYKDGGYCYFFVQSDAHYCFNGNGQQELERLAPRFDISQLDVNRYDYVVAVNCRIRSIRYSYGSAYKTMSVGIDTYVADADLTKTQDDSIRVYRMKKVNIDYDYKKYGSIGTDFRVAEE